jgi:hypothetical protein
MFRLYGVSRHFCVFSREEALTYFQSRRTDSMSVPGSPSGLGVDGALRENRGAGDGSSTSPS